jgi:hypothetical protein
MNTTDLDKINNILMHLEIKIDKISQIAENSNITNIENMCDESSSLISDILTILENNI